MSRRLPIFVRLVPVLAIAVGLTACTAKPENSPVIRKKFAEVEEIKDQLDTSAKLLRNVAGEITILRDEVSNLRALAPDGEGGVELVARLEAIEQRITKMEKGRDRVVASAVLPAAKKTATTSDFNGLATPKTPEKKAEQSNSVTKPAAPKKATPRAAPAPTVPRGRYYTIQAGDTLEKIASTNGLSLSDLAKANRLPSGARPLKGQRLFIPGK